MGERRKKPKTIWSNWEYLLFHMYRNTKYRPFLVYVIEGIECSLVSESCDRNKYYEIMKFSAKAIKCLKKRTFFIDFIYRFSCSMMIERSHKIQWNLFAWFRTRVCKYSAFTNAHELSRFDIVSECEKPTELYCKCLFWYDNEKKAKWFTDAIKIANCSHPTNSHA